MNKQENMMAVKLLFVSESQMRIQVTRFSHFKAIINSNFFIMQIPQIANIAKT